MVKHNVPYVVEKRCVLNGCIYCRGTEKWWWKVDVNVSLTTVHRKSGCHVKDELHDQSGEAHYHFDIYIRIFVTIIIHYLEIMIKF